MIKIKLEQFKVRYPEKYSKKAFVELRKQKREIAKLEKSLEKEGLKCVRVDAEFAYYE